VRDDAGKFHIPVRTSKWVFPQLIFQGHLIVAGGQEFVGNSRELALTEPKDLFAAFLK